MTFTVLDNMCAVDTGLIKAHPFAEINTLGLTSTTMFFSGAVV